MGVINAELQVSSLQLCTQNDANVGRVIVEMHLLVPINQSRGTYLFLLTLDCSLKALLRSISRTYS